MADPATHVEGEAFKSDSKQQKWTKRHFILKEGKLGYYAKAGSSELKGEFDLTRLAPGFLLEFLPPPPGVPVSARKPPPGENNVILMMPSGRAFCMSFDDIDEYNKWNTVFEEIRERVEAADAAAVDDVDVSITAGAGAGGESSTVLVEVDVKAHGMVTKCDKSSKRWQARWFVLDGYMLSYYVKEGQTKAKGTINLSKLPRAFLVEDYVLPSGGKPPPTPYTLALRLGARLFGMCFTDDEDRDYWLGWFRYVHAKLHPEEAQTEKPEDRADTPAMPAEEEETKAVEQPEEPEEALEDAARRIQMAMRKRAVDKKVEQRVQEKAASTIQLANRKRLVNQRILTRKEQSQAATTIQMAARRRAVAKRSAERAEAAAKEAAAGEEQQTPSEPAEAPKPPEPVVEPPKKCCSVM